MGDSFYDRLPLELVAGFFYQIHRNIDKGILSDAMHQEVKLLERTAKRRGIPLKDLYEQGSRLIELEKAILRQDAITTPHTAPSHNVQNFFAIRNLNKN
ncbi:hypothetical protein ACFPYN_05665 [Paenisporosarcina macmurdoensis]|uniref:Uncharacterized protein n=1 Tax=Paenisporosarcina macmurdoensis TaxID=212659 RepID=A0ABW1L5R4_9BACL